MKLTQSRRFISHQVFAVAALRFEQSRSTPPFMRPLVSDTSIKQRRPPPARLAHGHAVNHRQALHERLHLGSGGAAQVNEKRERHALLVGFADDVS
jgi:hypothetical protein